MVLEQRWPELVRDIETGVLNPALDIPESIRDEIQQEMRPNVKRASELEEQFKLGFDGIARRIWPSLNLILATTTGSMSLYNSALSSNTCSKVPMYSPIYGASEGLLGVNLVPDTTESYYCLIPNAQFFEFIKTSNSSEEQPSTLLLHQLVLGEQYEVVISNPSGLYRYRLGDVVEVVQFFNEIPVIKFKYRQGQMLNVHGEKLSEESFYKTLQQAAQVWGVNILDYYTCENVLDEKDQKLSPHYLVFVESDNPIKSPEILDEKLQENHPVYRSFRVKGSIGSLEIIQVKKGSFEMLKKWLLLNTQASSNQIKIPRVIKRKEAVNLMLENRI